MKLIPLLTLSAALVCAAPTPLVAQAAQPTRPATTQEARHSGLAVNFVDAPLGDVIRALGRLLGLTVVLSEVPEQRVTLSTASATTSGDVGALLESLLETHALMLIPRGTIAQVMPVAQAPATGAVYAEGTLPSPAPVGLVTVLRPLKGLRAEEAVSALRAVASASARIEPVTRTNAMLVTDRGVHVARYLELLARLDEAPLGEAGLRTYVVPLRFADAEDLASALGQAYDVVVAGGRSGSLADRGLSAALDGFRRRELETFRARPAGATDATAAPVRADSAGAAQAGALVGRTTIVPSIPTNALIIRTAPPNYPLLRETIEALDARPPQVLFEVTVAEVALGRGEEFGVNWSAIGRDAGVRVGDPDVDDATSGRQDFALRVSSLNDIDVRAVLRAIASRTNVRVLSTPEILAANNREARILVGSRVPFISSTRLGNDVAIDRAVQYQDVGTTLTIVPTVNQDDYVSVRILQEVSSLTTQTVSAALNAPIISTREATTRAIIRNGQTVVIGGLIGSAQEQSESGVPLLKDLPLLGALFKRQARSNSRTEIAIFVTPRVIRTDAEADALRERSQQRLDGVAPGVLTPPARRPPNTP